MDESIDFFRDLDAGFINFEKSADSFHWNTTNITILREWSLPIPVQLPGSIVSYSFATEFGDISFGAIFYTTEGTENVILESTRVPSDVEAITGSFKVPRDGTVVFIWDNSFSWLTSKTLSYSIELHQPSFAAADNARSLRARATLHSIIEDTRRAELRIAKSQDQMQSLSSDITHLAERMRALQLEYESKATLFKSLATECGALESQISTNAGKRPGLCIRMLDRTILARILSSFDESAQEVRTCKYWVALHAEAIGAPKVAYDS
eukprot:gene12516-26371_t